MAGKPNGHQLNGIDVDGLKLLVGRMKDKSLAWFQFAVHNRWLGGSRNKTEMHGFTGEKRHIKHDQTFRADNDEPHILLGNDQKPNPVEWVLHALAGCVTTTVAAHAAARGIEIESIESDLEGDLDVRGFLGLDADTPKGYQTIRVRMKVKSDADAAKLEELAQYSPVLNTLRNPVDVRVTIEKV